MPVRSSKLMEPPLDDATIEQRVEARLNGRPLLTQDDGPSFHCILDEGALRRPVGGPSVMRAQLERIIELASLPKVTFQLIPLDLGAHPGLDSTFVILNFETPMVNDVVYVEGHVGNIYLEDVADLERYKQIFSRLHSMALNPEDSIAAVKRIAATYKLPSAPYRITANVPIYLTGIIPEEPRGSRIFSSQSGDGKYTKLENGGDNVRKNNAERSGA